MKKGWAMKVALQFSIQGLVAYKSVADKKGAMRQKLQYQPEA